MRRNRNGRSHADDEGQSDDDGDQTRRAFDSTSPLQSQALGDALGAYNFAPLSTPVSEAVDHENRLDVRRADPQPVHDPPLASPLASPTEEALMAANPLYYVDLSQPGDAVSNPLLDEAPVEATGVEVGDDVAVPIEAPLFAPAPAPAVALLRTPESKVDLQNVSAANPSILELVEQLTEARCAVSDAFEFCAASAEQMDVTAATFTAAASGLRAAGAQQRGIHAMMGDAIHQIASMNDEIERERAAALAEKIEMLDRAQRETEQLRTVALADVDRARSRLLQFTNEFSSVASELQGALATDRVTNGHG